MQRGTEFPIWINILEYAHIHKARPVFCQAMVIIWIFYDFLKISFIHQVHFWWME